MKEERTQEENMLEISGTHMHTQSNLVRVESLKNDNMRRIFLIVVPHLFCPVMTRPHDGWSWNSYTLQCFDSIYNQFTMFYNCYDRQTVPLNNLMLDSRCGKFSWRVLSCCQVDTHITSIFLSFLCKIITRSDHSRETSFSSLLLKLLSIGNLQTEVDMLNLIHVQKYMIHIRVQGTLYYWVTHVNHQAIFH